MFATAVLGLAVDDELKFFQRKTWSSSLRGCWIRDHL